MTRAFSNYLVIALALVFALSLTGCGSESGATPDPLVLQAYSETCSLCHDSGSVADLDIVHSIATNSPEGEITGVTIAGGTVTVAFKLFDSTNSLIPLAGVASSSIRFTIAQLDAAGNWQSYINTTETKAAGDPGTAADGTTAVHATYEKASDNDGTFIDNLDGSYTYEFSFDISTVTTPLAVTYTDTLTHRVAMQVSGNVSNAIYDFRPSDGATAGITTRDIVMNASCNECHVKLGFHGSDRIQVEYCVT